MTFSRVLAVFYFLLLVVTCPVLGQRIEWAKSTIRGTNEASLYDKVAVDASGNSYVAGAVLDSVITPLGTLVAPPRIQPFLFSIGGIFLLKYNAQGQAQWLRHITNAYVLEVDADAAGNLYMIGRNDSNAVFDASTTLVLPSLFLAKFSPNGVVQWAHPIRMPANTDNPAEVFNRLQVDAAGNAYTQTFWALSVRTPAATDSVNQLPVATRGILNAVVAKFDPTGATQWALTITRKAGSVGGIAPLDLDFTVDNTGSCYLTGNARDTLQFNAPDSAYTVGLPMLVTSNNGRGFIVKLNSAGHLVRHIENSRRDTSNLGFGSLATDSRGNFYISRDNKITKYRFNGDSLWTRTIPSSSSTPQTGYITALLINSQDKLFAISRPANDAGLLVAMTDTSLATASFVHNLYLDALYSNEWSRPATDGMGNAYVLAESSGAPFDGFTVGPDYVHGWGSTLIKLNPQTTQLSGEVYLDANANGQRDTGELPFGRQLLVAEALRPYSAVTSPTNGAFVAYADTGYYDLRLPEVPSHYRLTQGSSGYQGHVQAYGQRAQNLDFGLTPIPNQTDVRVTLTAQTPARRGFANRYRVRVENIGSTPLTAGQLTVAFDPVMSYIGAMPNPATHTSTTATWPLLHLAPFAVQYFDVASTVPLTTPLDTLLTSSATVTVAGDVDLTNNTEALAQHVFGSYDPNELTVNYSALTTAQIASGTPLDYLIRFENLGNDTAFTVIIEDTLPAHLLRLGTLQLLSASHNCWWDVLDNTHLVIRFENINLPNSAVDPIGAHGFALFQVVPRATLVPGTRIPNTAHITFDYNAPLTTNPVSTLVQNPNGLVAEARATTLNLYPNPATDRTLLTATLPTAGTVQVLLADALGRPVRRTSVTAPAGAWQHGLDAKGLTPGVYVVRLTLPDGATVSRRLVVQE